MRIVIDKDYQDVQLLNEAYKKGLPTYKVLAVEADGEKFVYGKGLLLKEVADSMKGLAYDTAFDGCQAEIVECTKAGEHVVWSSDEKSMVVESQIVNEGFLDWLKGLGAGIADLFKNNPITKWFKDKAEEWRKNNYITKDDQLTGLGYKIATGQEKPNLKGGADDKTGAEGAEGEDKEKTDPNAELQENLKRVWDFKVQQCVQALQKQGYKDAKPEDIAAITIHGDGKPIQIQATVKGEDGKEMFLMMTQKGDIAKGDGKGNVDKETTVTAADAEKAAAAGETETGTPPPSDAGTETTTGGKGDLETRVSNIENALEKQGIKLESTSNSWNFNDQMMTNKVGLERATIKRFFNELNDGSVKEIKFVSESGNVKSYETANGSAAYTEFKKDFKESTENAVGKCAAYKVTFESGFKSKLNGYKFSNFGMSDDFDSDSKVVIIKESWLKFTPDNEDDSKKKADLPVTESVVGQTAPVVKESFTLELDKQDPAAKVKALVASMNKYGGQMECPDFEASVSTGVSTYPDVATFETPKKQEPFETPKDENVVTEAEGDEEDPFAGGDDAGGDAGGEDAGGEDAGGEEADPFGGSDEAGGDEGAVAGGEEADPFGGGGEAGGDAGGGAGGAGGGMGGDLGGDDAGGDAGAEGGDEAAGEPAAPDAVNTDAQGNEKSQYNINVTKPYNNEEDFTLNEEEQKEFFGKIDQLVKIPDMDNYSLYLYQITPENMNLDDVHYIEALYQLSVKLGLLEDVYADSNLLEKYNSYKYSIVKDGDKSEDEELKVQESSMVMEGTAKVQDDNQKKNEESKKIGASEKDDERRGPKDMKLDLDKNGAQKPTIIDTTKDGWDSLNGKEHGKAIDSTVEGDFHGLGWIATFKAMQFGSPRYLSLYIKKNGKGKAEDQCREYLEKLSYTDIEFVNIDEVDPYEYIYRQSASGMKTPETVRTEKYANEGVPVTYLENKETKVPESIPGDIAKDVKRVITKLNTEIRNTKQFNFLKECGIPKPQIDHSEFLTHYKTAQFNETLSETTYKFVLRKNDSTLSRMFFSNMKEKLFKYLGSFAQKFGMECGCEATPTCVVIDFMRSDLDPMAGYDIDGMIDADVELPPSPIENKVADVMN